MVTNLVSYLFSYMYNTARLKSHYVLVTVNSLLRLRVHKVVVTPPTIVVYARGCGVVCTLGKPAWGEKALHHFTHCAFLLHNSLTQATNGN